MAKREWSLRFACPHPECKETITYRYSTLRDRSSSFEARHYGANGWKCTRHADPDRVLSATNPETRFEVVSDQRDHGRYFGHNGLVTGPGFLVYASDLPAGTKLIVTARIELPAAASLATQTPAQTPKEDAPSRQPGDDKS